VNLLALLIVLVVGVVLGYWLQNPALAERQRAVRIKERHAKRILADAQLKLWLAQDKLRIVQAVRAQTSEMIDEMVKVPMPKRDALSGPAPIFEGMHNWLASTGSMPVLQAPPKAKAKRQKVSVTVGDEVRSELIEVSAS
jgi:hypothetical protein